MQFSSCAQSDNAAVSSWVSGLFKRHLFIKPFSFIRKIDPTYQDCHDQMLWWQVIIYEWLFSILSWFIVFNSYFFLFDWFITHLFFHFLIWVLLIFIAVIIVFLFLILIIKHIFSLVYEIKISKISPTSMCLLINLTS